MRDREKLDFLKLRFYNQQNDHFFGSKSDIINANIFQLQ